MADAVHIRLLVVSGRRCGWSAEAGGMRFDQAKMKGKQRYQEQEDGEQGAPGEGTHGSLAGTGVAHQVVERRTEAGDDDGKDQQEQDFG